MTNIQARVSSQSKLTATARATKSSTSKRPEKARPKSTTSSNADGALQEAYVSKRERVLALLNKPDGATIEDIMKVTDWQQHSVRGFLAGTVKKKLGFSLTSSKAEGETRCYRIARRRGR